MAGVRTLLGRVRRLEQAQVSPWLKLLGPVEEFEATVQAGIREGRYDPRDMRTVLASVRRWIKAT